MEASALQAPARLTGISLSAPLLRLRSDEQLVALFRAGSEEAFRVIHDRYRQRLLAYVRQMLAGSRPDAEDALQDVFLRAHAALRANERPISLRAWLYRVAHNRCIDQLRRPVPVPLEVVELTRSSSPDPFDEAERREDLRLLVADVRRLPAQQRSVLLMRELEGASYADLADAHGLTVAAVKSLLVRARIGLVRAAEARDIACVEIRTDLASARERGVRATGRARRHLRDCSSCREYRTELRATSRQLAGIVPGGPLAALAKLLGLGAGSGSAAAGSSAAAGGGAAASSGAVAGGGIAAATVCKVAAVVCSTVVVAGGAAEVKQKLTGTSAGPVPREASGVRATAGERVQAAPVASVSAPASSAPARPAASRAASGAKNGAAARVATKPAAVALPTAVPENDFPYGIAEDPAPQLAPDEPDGPVAEAPGGSLPLAGPDASAPDAAVPTDPAVQAEGEAPLQLDAGVTATDADRDPPAGAAPSDAGASEEQKLQAAQASAD